MFIKTLTNQPGVYLMYDAFGTVIYVGKAKNLKKRLTSYFYDGLISRKLKILVAQIKQIDITVTNTETEALLLEQNYIKFYQPRYNVLLRDDKSYPFILLSNETYPRLVIHRGIRYDKGEYFGPFPNVHAVKKTLTLLKKIFPIRQCDNNVYRNRSRPCMQYQIGRCLGPCITKLVSKDIYTQQVEYVRMFLKGKDHQILNKLINSMEKAIEILAFEEAARIRDQIQAVRKITEKQFISNNKNNLDVISFAFDANIICAHIIFIRCGKILGGRSYFFKSPNNTEPSKVIEIFIDLFYLKNRQANTLISEILIDFSIKNKITDKTILVDSLSERIGQNVNLQTKPRGKRAYYLKLARINAINALKTKLSEHSIIHQRLNALATLLKIPEVKRIECFDISHTMGEKTVASCVVFDDNGPIRAEYRHYNISGITPGDDYAAINQVLFRRYNKEIEESKIPNIILLDGGKGQLSQAKKVFANLNVKWDKNRPLLISIAKSTHSSSGLDALFFEVDGKGFSLPKDSPALHAIQYIRDESHKHAISNHRKKLAKIRKTSTIENIEGIGPKRRQALLKYMGGLQGLLNASIEEIIKVPGISQILAKKIYLSLRD